MAAQFPLLGRFLPFLPRLGLRFGAILAQPERATQLRRIAAQDHAQAAGADIYVATPRRFLRPDKLARKRTALTNLLDLIEIVQEEAGSRGLRARLVAVEHLPRLPPARLILSHHTVEDQGFAALRAGGAEVWHVKTGDLPGSVVIDARGFSGWSSLAGKSLADLDLNALDLDQARRRFAAQRERIIGGQVSKYGQTATAEPQIAAPYVFVALQTIGDMVQRQAYMPMLTMARLVVDRFAGTPVTVVFKRHPKCRSLRVWWALRQLARQDHVRVAKGSIHDLLARAEALVTVNSGVGSEAMLHSVPIYCFGRADYAPIAHQVHSAAEFKRLTDPIRPACGADDLVRFHEFYRHTHQSQGKADLRERVVGILDRRFAGTR